MDILEIAIESTVVMDYSDKRPLFCTILMPLYLSIENASFFKSPTLALLTVQLSFCLRQ